MFSGKNLVPAILLVLLSLASIGAAGLSISYVRIIRDFRQAQIQAMNVNRSRAVVQAMANDAMEYSKRNPAIDPILQSVGLKGKSIATTSTSGKVK